MSKFSVKKPFTVFVAVIAILVLGVVAYFKMTPDLLPNMDFPYVMIMTTYPGASPEKVEAEITKPMEQTMSTLEHIKSVSSTSSENYSMVMLEFEESVNMDTIGVDIQQNISTLSAAWSEMVGTPYVLKINPSMLPVEVAAVSMEGMTTMELTDFLDDTLMNKLEGIEGVARISTTGAITQEVHVILDQGMIDALNEKIQDVVNGELDDAAQELSKQKNEMQSAKNQMQAAKDQIKDGKAALEELQKQKALLEVTKAGLEGSVSLTETALKELEDSFAPAEPLYGQVLELAQQQESAQAELESLYAQLTQLNADKEAIAAIEAEIAALDPTAEDYAETLAALESRKAVIESGMADEAALLEQIAYWEGQLSIAQTGLAELDAALQQVDPTLNSSTVIALKNAIDTTKGTLEELNQKLAETEAGLTMLEQAEDQLADLDSAQVELAVGSATIDQALTQIEGGMDTLEESREDALDQADVTGIITMDMVSQILTAQNFAMPAGFVEQEGINYMVSVGDEITDVETLENLLLFDMGMEDVGPIYLKDVAVVMLTDNRDETYAKLDGENAIMLSFEKQSTYATAETTNSINARFRELEQEYPGLHFVALMNQGDYIYLIVETILNSLLLGAVFAIIVLFLFLKDLRPTFITLCSIPISVIFAIVLMYFSGVTINMISLSGLAVAVGMLVDNSVVVIENIYRLRSKGANVIQAAVSGAGQVAGAVTASTLTTVCVFLPIVFVEGITKQLFTDLALTMTYALMASLIVSLTLVPAMASGMLRKQKETRTGFMERFLAVYEKAAAWSLDHKAVVLLASLALLLLTGWASLSKGFIFMPEMDMPNVNVSVTMPEGSTMEEASAMADEVLERIGTIDGIATVGAMMDVGTASVAGMSETSYSLTIYITLSDQDAFGSEVGRQIEDLCADMACEVSSSSAMMDMGALGGTGISLRIYADHMDDLQNAAKEAASVLEGIEGVSEVSDGLEDAAPALHVDIDRNKAMEKGLTVAQIYMELASALTTTNSTTTLEIEGSSTTVVIEKPEGAVLTVDGLKNYEFEVTGQDGEKKTFVLSDVAEIVETSSLSTISRMQQRRYLSVTAYLEPGYNVTLLTAEAEQAIGDTDLGDGISYVFSGENETIMEAMEQLMLMLLLGVLLVYLVMVAQFQSLKSPFIVMFTIPLAFTGGFMALLLCNMEISVISLIGFIMLTGIIVNNGIVLVDYINQLRLEGIERRAAIVEAGSTRMRPILMTTVTTVLGLIDMAVNKSAGTAMMQPVAVVCIGGLVYATLMTLFVVPVIYDIFNKKQLRNVREEDLKLLDL